MMPTKVISYYLDQEAIPGERNRFLRQVPFVKLGNGFLHAIFYHSINLGSVKWYFACLYSVFYCKSLIQTSISYAVKHCYSENAYNKLALTAK